MADLLRSQQPPRCRHALESTLLNLLAAQHRDEDARVAEIGAQLDPRHRGEADARIFQLFADHHGYFAANLVLKPLLAASSEGHDLSFDYLLTLRDRGIGASAREYFSNLLV